MQFCEHVLEAILLLRAAKELVYSLQVFDLFQFPATRWMLQKRKSGLRYVGSMHDDAVNVGVRAVLLEAGAEHTRP